VVVKITPKRQVTLPACVVDALGVGPGDQLELVEGDDGFILRPRRLDLSHVGTLHDKIKRGRGPCDLAEMRKQAHDPALRN